MNNDKKNILTLLSGRWTSKIGSVVFDYVNTVALVNINAKSSILIAAYQSAETLIKLFGTMLAGTQADRIKKKKNALIITDIISGLICIILGFLLRDSLVAYIIILANCLLAIVELINSPLYKTIVREAIRRDNIVKLNSISNAGCEGLSLIGPVIGALLVKLVGIRVGLLFNGITFIASAAVELFIEVDVNEMIANKKENIWVGLRNGIVYILKNKQLLKIFAFSGCINFFLAGCGIFIPYADTIFEVASSGMYTRIIVVQGIAALIGSVVSIRISKYFRGRIKRIELLCTLIGLSLLSIPLVKHYNSVLLILVPFVFTGLFTTIFNVQYISYLQETVEVEYIGRVFGVLNTLSLLLVPIGAFVFSGAFGINGLLGFTVGGAGIVLASLFWGLFL